MGLKEFSFKFSDGIFEVTKSQIHFWKSIEREEVANFANDDVSESQLVNVFQNIPDKKCSSAHCSYIMLSTKG